MIFGQSVLYYFTVKMYNFKILCLVVLFSGLGSSAPADDVKLLRYDNQIDENGYKFSFEQSDGQKRDEEGSVQIISPEESLLKVKGSYSFVGADNVVYTVTYIADENGFQPTGDHLPKAEAPVKSNNNNNNIPLSAIRTKFN